MITTETTVVTVTAPSPLPPEVTGEKRDGKVSSPASLLFPSFLPSYLLHFLLWHLPGTIVFVPLHLFGSASCFVTAVHSHSSSSSSPCHSPSCPAPPPPLQPPSISHVLSFFSLCFLWPLWSLNESWSATPSSVSTIFPVGFCLWCIPH